MEHYPQKGMVIVERQKDASPMRVLEVNPAFVTGVSVGDKTKRKRQVRMRTVRKRFRMVHKARGADLIEWGEQVR